MYLLACLLVAVWARLYAKFIIVQTRNKGLVCMTEQIKLTSNKEVLAYLAEKFPLCFILEGEARPLKIGIFQDLAIALEGEELVSKTQVRQALRHYTSNWRYLHGCRKGAKRVDLQGNDCGELDAEHVEHAAQQLKEAKERVAARRAAQNAERKQKQANTKEKTVKSTKTNADRKKKSSKPAAKRPNKTVATKPALNLELASLESLKIGDKVHVKFAENTNAAIVAELNRDSVRVQLKNGLTINANAENIFVEA